MRPFVATLTLLAAAGCSAQPATPPQPMTFAAARDLVDLTEVPAPDGAYRSSSSGVQSSASVSLGEARTFEAVVEHYDAWLKANGWESLAANRSGTYVDDIYQKQGLRLNFSAGKSRGFPTGEDVNAGLFLLGNIDPRALPRPEGVALTNESPSMVDYKTRLPISEVRKFYTQQMTQRGWTEFRTPAPGRVEIPWEVTEKEQHFLSGAVTVNLNYLPEEAEGDKPVPLRVLMRVALEPIDVVIPEGADDVKFAPDPLDYTFVLRQTLEDSAKTVEPLLEAQGYLGAPTKPSFERIGRAIEFTREGSPALVVEYLESGRITFVGMTQKTSP